MDTVRMFVNGQGMRGGEFNDAFDDATFLGEVRTAARYRFFSVRDVFPGIWRDDDRGAEIAGELYELPYLMLADRLLPREPQELELDIITLSDGSGCLSMVMRSSSLDLPGVSDITAHGGWRSYLGAGNAAGR